jgi:hypothetical protein
MKSKYFADAAINKEGGEEIISNHITEAGPRNENIAVPSDINMKLVASFTNETIWSSSIHEQII